MPCQLATNAAIQERIRAEVWRKVHAWLESNSRSSPERVSCFSQLQNQLCLTSASEEEISEESYTKSFERYDCYSCVHQIQLGDSKFVFEGQRICNWREDLQDQAGLVNSTHCTCQLFDVKRQRLLWEAEVEELNGVAQCFTRIDVDAFKDSNIWVVETAMPVEEIISLTLCFAGQRCTEFLEQHILTHLHAQAAGHVLQPQPHCGIGQPISTKRQYDDSLGVQCCSKKVRPVVLKAPPHCGEKRFLIVEQRTAKRACG